MDSEGSGRSARRSLAMVGMSGIWIGTSGWSYDHWDAVLYGPTLPPAEPARRYVQEFDTVELNASFYRWPRAQTFRQLATAAAARVPDEREGPPWPQPRPPPVSARALDPPTRQCWHELRDRRGVLLVQLPPDQERDDDRLDYFLRGLPDWMQVAIELRHPSWIADPVFDLLGRHRATYVVMSGARLPCVLRATLQRGVRATPRPRP